MDTSGDGDDHNDQNGQDEDGSHEKGKTVVAVKSDGLGFDWQEHKHACGCGKVSGGCGYS